MMTMKEILEKFSAARDQKILKVMNDAIAQAVICGEVTIRYTDQKTFEIVNPFKGCGCEEPKPFGMEIK